MSVPDEADPDLLARFHLTTRRFCSRTGATSLRRTGDTIMNEELDIDPHVVEAILNHVSGGTSGKDGVAESTTRR